MQRERRQNTIVFTKSLAGRIQGLLIILKTLSFDFLSFFECMIILSIWVVSHYLSINLSLACISQHILMQSKVKLRAKKQGDDKPDFHAFVLS